MNATKDVWRLALGLTMGVALIATQSNAQSVHISVNSADLAAAAAKEPLPPHLLSARPGPNSYPDLAVQFNKATFEATERNVEELNKTGSTAEQGGAGKESSLFPAIGGGPSPPFDPASVSNPSGGQTIGRATQYNLYVGCGTKGGSCWGNPSKFESDLNGSDFIKILDQYVGSSVANKFAVSSLSCEAAVPNTDLSDSDILALLTTCYKSIGIHGGSVPIYHIFLASGIDVCTFYDDRDYCYSPDGKHLHSVCGYHNYTMINSNLVVYTVEPYQAVDGCYGKGQNIVNATANVLSHELFEAISDPVFGTAWLARHAALAKYGFEIGDLCVWEFLNVTIGGTTYKIQGEYSNKLSTCSIYDSPPSPSPLPTG